MTVTWAWLAGFFDGEGSAGLYRESKGRALGYRYQASIAQSGDRGYHVLSDIALFLQEQGINCGLSTESKIRHGFVKSQLEGHKLQVRGSRNVLAFLRGMLPFLRVKKTVAQDIVRTAVLFPPNHHAILSDAAKQRNARRSGEYVEYYQGGCCRAS